uniref:L-2,4-diaminobutyric acid acetyltransferase n=1 Tax=Streptomyces sp. WS017 TaxID=1814033 RepID=A0A159YK43_9ACTN|nr:L-2,4-diaminobutyric acid acetyltransferase subunit [Streptomyces sp. WS017]
MTAAPADFARARSAFLSIDAPRVEDGAAIWRIARDSKVLDLNSSYSYLLWCRDFAATSAVARGPNGAPIAFVTPPIRPDRPQTLVVWQVAVDQAHRGKGLAAALLDALTARVAADQGLASVETTITPPPTASARLFTSYAQRHDVALEKEVLFPGALFPEETHLPEVLYRIGPFAD